MTDHAQRDTVEQLRARVAELERELTWQRNAHNACRDEIKIMGKQLATVTAERNAYDKALHSLTPGGSEYAHDAKACVEAVRRMRDSQHEALCSFKRQRDEALNKLAALTLTWTTARPTVAGWYWYRKDASDDDPMIIDIQEVSFASGQGHWAGPIRGPEETT